MTFSYRTLVRFGVSTKSDHVHTSAAVIGATVSIVGHPEFGTTATRSPDGGYDIVVNGGGNYTVQFVASGYMTAQHTARTRWLDWTSLPDAALVAPDPTKTITLGSGIWQWVRGATKSDGDGSRTATVLVPPGTTIHDCVGTTTGGCTGGNWTGGSPNVHATEFTVANAGRSSMPGDLPPQSGYTYAVEAGLTLGGNPIDTKVTFANSYGPSSPPTGVYGDVFFYLENFTGTLVDGTSNSLVPAGSYDRTKGIWQPESSGKTYCVLGVSAGRLRLSATKSGAACGIELPLTGNDYAGEDPVITSGERTMLADNNIYGTTAANTTIWRVPMPHFSVWDHNWGAGPPSGAIPPPNQPPRSDTPHPDPCQVAGSIVECENQVVRESIPITGTPYSLNYRSETQAGYHPTIYVPISTASATNQLPPSTVLKRIEAEIQVAGQDVILQGNTSLTTTPQALSWSWDRTDAYGRHVKGGAHASVEVRYVYQAVPFTAGNFGDVGPLVISGNRSTRELWYSADYDFEIGAFDDASLGLGGWTISAQHVYQPTTATLFRGDGTKRQPSLSPNVMHSVFADGAGDSNTRYITDIATPADGNVYVAHYDLATGAFLGRIESGALVSKTNTSEGSWVDGAALSSLKMNWLTRGNIITDPGGNLLVADACRVLRVVVPPRLTDALQVYLVAGDRAGNCNTSGFASDGVQAAGTAVANLYGIAALPDGTPIFIETYSGASRIRRVKANGALDTLLGDGLSTDPLLSGCPATSPFCTPHHMRLLGGNNYSIAVGSDSTLYLADGTGAARVYQLYPRDGSLHPYAGNGTAGFLGDGVLPSPSLPISTSGVEFNLEADVSISTAGPLVIVPGYDFTLRSIAANGVVATIAGVNASHAWGADGTFATRSPILPVRGVVGPDGNYYTTAAVSNGAIQHPNRVVRFRRADDTPSGADTLVMSEDGKEVYEFDSTGRHLYTKSKYSGATLLDMSSHYDTSGRLLAIDENVGTGGLKRTLNISGYGTSTITLTAPYGQVTTLTLSSGNLTQVQDPENAAHSRAGYTMAYDASHRLTQFVEPNDAIDSGHHTHNIAYTVSGLVSKDAPPGSAGTLMSRNVDMIRLRRHSKAHESAVGECHGEEEVHRGIQSGRHPTCA